MKDGKKYSNVNLNNEDEEGQNIWKVVASDRKEPREENGKMNAKNNRCIYKFEHS